MGFDEAVAAHTAWKRKLTQYFKRRDGALSPAEVAVDDQCPLGRWILGTGVRFANLPEYSVLKHEHARFHSAAADLVRRVNAGEAVMGQVAPGSHSEFSKASSGVVLAIMDIKKQVGD